MQTTYDGFLQNVFADDIYWGCKLIECLPPGPENEAGRPNPYGQPQVDYDESDDDDDLYPMTHGQPQVGYNEEEKQNWYSEKQN